MQECGMRGRRVLGGALGPARHEAVELKAQEAERIWEKPPR